MCSRAAPRRWSASTPTREAHEHARLRYRALEPALRARARRNLRRARRRVVFLQTIEHLENPGAVLAHFRSLVGDGGPVYVSTPNVLTLAPKGRRALGEPLARARVPRAGVRGAVPRELRARGACSACSTRARCARTSWRCAPGWDAAALAPRADRALLSSASRPRSRARDFALRSARARPIWTGRWTSSRCAAHERARRRSRGALAIVLHTHMPYVEGFDTWPFGEEWLWSAMIDCYLPLLELLDAGAPLTRLADAGAVRSARGRRHRASALRASSGRRGGAIHEQDVAGLRAAGHEALARELQRAWESDYEQRAASASTTAAATCWRPSRRTPSGPPRRPTRCSRCWPPTPARACRCAAASPPTAGASRQLVLARRLLAAGVRPRALAGADPRARRRARATCVELTGSLRPGRRRAPAAAARRRRGRARADRPRDDGAGVERRRLSGGRRLPRLPPPHDPSPQTVGQRRLAPTTTRGRWRSGARACRRLRRAHDRPPARRRRRAAGRRAGRVRAGHRAARALVV